MESKILITKERLVQIGFRPVPYRNMNDDSDTNVLVVYQNGATTIMNFGPSWLVCETGFGSLLIKEPILTMEELIEGINTHGLALEWNRCKKSDY